MKSNFLLIAALLLLLPATSWSQSDQGVENRLRAITRAYFKSAHAVLTGSDVATAVATSGEEEAIPASSRGVLNRRAALVSSMSADGVSYTKGRVASVDFVTTDIGAETATVTAKVGFEFTLKAGPGAPDRSSYSDAYRLTFTKSGNNKWSLTDAETLLPTALAGPAIPDSTDASILESMPRATDPASATTGRNPTMEDRRNRRGGNGNGNGGPNGSDEWRLPAIIDYQAAASYGLRHAENPNPAYRDFGNNCTNFVSQCMKAGGWTETGSVFNRTSNNVWFYGSWSGTTSYTWGGAHNFYFFCRDSGRAMRLSHLTSLLLSDVISIDFEGDGHIDHTVIVTQRWGSSANQINISYQTTNTKYRLLSDFMNMVPATTKYYAWGIY